jgi:hypothetical protein
MPLFAVLTPATDRTLLSAEELRVAAGLDRNDDSQDETLAELEAEVAAEITSDCGVASDGTNPPTLRSEECSDIFRLGYEEGVLYLSRRHVTAIDTIDEDGTELETTDWHVDSETGKLFRLVDDAASTWSGSKTTITYTAGFVTVPAELKAEAKARVKMKLSETSRDPLARSIRTEIPDVESLEIDYQVGGLGRLIGDGLAPESERRLKRFMTHSMVG